MACTGRECLDLHQKLRAAPIIQTPSSDPTPPPKSALERPRAVPRRHRTLPPPIPVDLHTKPPQNYSRGSLCFGAISGSRYQPANRPPRHPPTQTSAPTRLTSPLSSRFRLQLQETLQSQISSTSEVLPIPLPSPSRQVGSIARLAAFPLRASKPS